MVGGIEENAIAGGPRSGRLGSEERIPTEAGVPVAAIRVEDPELRPPPRRAESVPGDHHLRPLPDDVPAEPDPRPTGELEPKTGRFSERLVKARREAGRLEDDEHSAGPTGERREPMETIGNRRSPRRSPGARPRGHPSRAEILASVTEEVDEKEVDRPALHERSSHREAVVDRFRGKDDEPFEADPPGDRLDRIEAPGQVEVRDDRPARLSLGREAESESRLAAREIAPDGNARFTGDTARPKDRVERGKASPDDPAVIAPDGRAGRGRRRQGLRDLRTLRPRRLRQRDGRQCSDHVTDRCPEPARSCSTPACLQGCQGGCHIRGEGGHGPQMIEHLFYLSRPRMALFATLREARRARSPWRAHRDRATGPAAAARRGARPR